MIIKEAHIKKFGALQERIFRFSPGINVIYGENEAGKTTLQQFLKAMMFGLEKNRGRLSSSSPYARYEPWDTPSYFAGSLLFDTGRRQFLLERNFYYKESSSRLVNTQDLEELSVEQGDLEMLLGDVTAQKYENTYFISQDQYKPSKDLADLIRDEKNNLTSTGDGSFRLSVAVTMLEERQKKFEKERKEKENDREQRRRELQARLEDADRRKRQLELRALDQEQNVKTLRQQLAEKKNAYAVNAQENEQEIVIHGGHGERVQWNVWIVVGFVGFLLNHMFRNTEGYPHSIWVLFMIVFLIMIVGGVALTVKKNRIQEEQRRNEEKIRETQQRKTDTMKSEEIAFLRSKIATAQGAVQAVQEEMHEEEVYMENLQEQMKELEYPDVQEKDLEQKRDAVRLASETIARLSSKFREEKDDALNKRMSEILSRITSGRHDDIRLNEKKGMKVVEQFHARTPEAFSQATMQQMYFAYRMAAGSLLEGDEPLPYMLDEVFAAYDEKRLTEVLKWLAGENRQIFIFTCRKIEASILKKTDIDFLEISL